MSLFARRPAIGRPLTQASARTYHQVVGLYRQAQLPEVSLATLEEDTETLGRLREASKRLLAPYPMGLSNLNFLEFLRRDFGLRPGAGPVQEAKIVRGLARLMPDVSYVPPRDARSLDARKTLPYLVYPAFYGKLKRGARCAADYDESTPFGAAAFRQITDLVENLLEVHPRGLKRETFLHALKWKFSHDVSIDLAKELVDRMTAKGVNAKWEVSKEYSEYDALRLAKPLPPIKRPSSIVSRKRAQQERILSRFLRWYDDPASDNRWKKPRKPRPAGWAGGVKRSAVQDEQDATSATVSASASASAPA